MPNYLRINIEYQENLCTARDHAKIVRTLYLMEMHEHKRAILPRHFKDVPETKPFGAYGYQPRSRKWKIRKERKYPGSGELPNVYSGGLREAVCRASVIRGTQNGASLTAKNHLQPGQEHEGSVDGFWKHKGRRYSSKVNFVMTTQRRKEIEAISHREVERMAARMKANYLRLVRPGGPFRRIRRARLAPSQPSIPKAA